MHCLCPQAVGFSWGEVVQELGREGSEPRPPSEIDRLGSHTQWPDQTDLAFWGFVLFCSSNSPVFRHLHAFGNVLFKYLGRLQGRGESGFK